MIADIKHGTILSNNHNCTQTDNLARRIHSKNGQFLFLHIELIYTIKKMIFRK